MSFDNSSLNSLPIFRENLAENADNAPDRAAATPPATGSEAGDINLPALAYKVYLLLKQEMRLEQERLGRPRR